jgi:hypothetical protein
VCVTKGTSEVGKEDQGPGESYAGRVDNRPEEKQTTGTWRKSKDGRGQRTNPVGEIRRSISKLSGFRDGP